MYFHRERGRRSPVVRRGGGGGGGGEGGGRARLVLSVPGVLLIWIIAGQGSTALAAGEGGGCLDIFLSSVFSFFFRLLFWRRPDID